ncbi:het domain-containing protein [Podospora aff. communis PSN243]|uniref:Het domain-containing protein n=1 Tax=Podospora aff. communis PSN243 TaxID=3040156 RepID=A0AAV9GA50_9PEZI|nr:het domain-containing protein [Podospora aff. communis PSN243]
MRLIDVETLELSEFFGSSIPRYAILSHCWGVEEVTFQDWQDLDKASRKRGFPKIQGACRQAKRDHYRWLWVDTNCIDKTSSAELTEAINSMYQWYAGAGICYAYLSDLGPSNDIKFRHSKWFTRGWTLQELVAPRKVAFYDVDWNFIGLKAENHMQQYSESSSDFLQQISFATGISHEVLLNPESIRTQTVAQRMSWVSRRETTRVEDIAYCMLGLFDINMPLLYGEGMKAFMRLQEEIIKVSTDHSIFCWEWTASVPENWVGLLAPSPDTFASHDGSLYRHLFNYSPIYSMTNAGLSIRLPVINTTAGYMICLNGAQTATFPNPSGPVA